MSKVEDDAAEVLGEAISKIGSKIGILITEDPESGDILAVSMGADEESAEYASVLCDALWSSYNEFLKKECMH